MVPLPLGVVVHGVAALLIILVILAIIVLGVISLLRLSARGAKKLADKATGHPDGSAHH